MKSSNNKWAMVLALISIMGVIFGVVSIYLTYYYESRSEVSFKIINETNVLDVYVPLKGLTIKYDDRDLEGETLNIKIFEIQIENYGPKEITIDDYDQNVPWGFEIYNGEIAKVDLIYSVPSEIYLEINPQIVYGNTVEFEKIMLKEGDLFSLEVIVLHDRDELPLIKPFGRIANVDLDIGRGEELTEEDVKLIAIFMGGIVILFLAILIIVLLGKDKIDFRSSFR